MGVRGRSNTDVVFTVRGAQGFLFGTPLVDEKRAADVRVVLEGVLRQEHHDGVQWVVVDLCTVPLLEELRLVFRSLQSICLVTVHLVMKYKSAFGNIESPGSTLLRRMMRRFNLPRVARVTCGQSLLCFVICPLCVCCCACHSLCVWRIFLVLPGGGTDAIPPLVYTGVAAVAQDSGDKDALMHCRKSSLPRDAVDKALKTIEGEAPWTSHVTPQTCRGPWQTQDKVASCLGAQQRSPTIFAPEAHASCSRHGNHW